MIKEGFNKYFWDVIKNHYCDFKGRATRKQYWMFVVWSVILNSILRLICEIILKENTTGIIIIFVIAMVCGLALFLPYLAITCRRFKDAGISLTCFFTILTLQILSGIVFSVLMVLVFLYLIKGGSGPLNLEVIVPLAVIAGFIVFASSIAMFIICLLPSKCAPIDQPNQLDQLN